MNFPTSRPSSNGRSASIWSRLRSHQRTANSAAMMSSEKRLRTTLAGLPNTIAYGATSSITIEPAPTTAPSPIVTPEGDDSVAGNPDVGADHDIAARARIPCRSKTLSVEIRCRDRVGWVIAAEHKRGARGDAAIFADDQARRIIESNLRLTHRIVADLETVVGDIESEPPPQFVATIDAPAIPTHSLLMEKGRQRRHRDDPYT